MSENMSQSNCLKKIVELIGHQATIRLVRAKGGQCFKLPMTEHLNDVHWLVVTVGMNNAKKLCDYYAQSDKIKLPIEVNALLQLRNAAIAIDYQSGMSISQIAKDYQVDRKLIQNILDMGFFRHKNHQMNLM